MISTLFDIFDTSKASSAPCQFHLLHCGARGELLTYPVLSVKKTPHMANFTTQAVFQWRQKMLYMCTPGYKTGKTRICKLHYVPLTPQSH